MELDDKLKKLRNKLLEKKTEQIQIDDRTTAKKAEDITEEERRMLDSVHKFREGYISPADEAIANHFVKVRDVDLNAKVDNFIKWYSKNIDSDYTRKYKVDDMRNFIEKMAVWYELRYPDYEIDRLMFSASEEKSKINDVMFNENKHINEVFDENADIGTLDYYFYHVKTFIDSLDWCEFYNAKTFIDSLPCNEKELLNKAKYKELVYLDSDNSGAHLYLTSDGFVKDSKRIEEYTNCKIGNYELKNLHIKNVLKLFEEKDISLPSGNGLEKTIEDVEKWNYQKEEMLNCVMYRIIERGGERVGPRRAFIFAKEFGRNIDIPMMYGVDYSDPRLGNFINEYIKAGGSKDLICYIGYFSRTNKEQKLDTKPILDLTVIKNDATTSYTPEEAALYQRMVNALVIHQEDAKKDEAKQLRLQRKLNKSKDKKS